MSPKQGIENIETYSNTLKKLNYIGIGYVRKRQGLKIQRNAVICRFRNLRDQSTFSRAGSPNNQSTMARKIQ
jgi:hypothetical protein